MIKVLTRRDFARLSTAAALGTRYVASQSSVPSPQVNERNDGLEVRGARYSWEYTKANDTFRLLDTQRRVMTIGRLQPAILISREALSPASFSPGHLRQWHVEPGRVIFEYTGVNGNATSTLAWHFEGEQLWLEPVTYNAPETEDVVSLRYFVDSKDGKVRPSLSSSYFVVPGISESSAVSPVVQDLVHLNETVWLGRGSPVPGLLQQWGLPVHFFCGFNIAAARGSTEAYSRHRSEAFTCGLGELPQGDLFFDLSEGKSSLWIDYRSDLWKHLRTPGKLTLGSQLLWVCGANYYDAIGRYYAALIAAGVVRAKQDVPQKTAAALTPQFCTWGAQVAEEKASGNLDEAFLRKLYAQFKSSGMKAGMFSIDDKWEGTYGKLEHSAERFPRFEQFLDEVRADGHRIGIWAALMRCERPVDLGLTEDHVLKQPDGKPYVASQHPQYFILDFTQPEVARVLSELAQKFVRRYRPDLVKFDFGYELPPMSKAAPKDKQWSGERLMWKGLDVVIRAMREEKPDLVVMYYQLSPFFIEYFDLHSPDDLFLASGEYDVEANRRLFFSSLLGRLGIPTYGSSGYDWASAPNIWFDSAAVGTVGSLNDFTNDEQGEGATADRIARYNGLTEILRPAAKFDILPIGVEYEAATRGAHAHSWARFEAGELVLLALRPIAKADENPLAVPVSAAVAKAVRADMPVVVASKDNLGLGACAKLGIVPYGDGSISIRRTKGGIARVTYHYFGGKATNSNAVVQREHLVLKIRREDLSAQPLEWIEIEVA